MCQVSETLQAKILKLGQAELSAQNKKLVRKNIELGKASKSQLEMTSELELQNRELKARLASAAKGKRKLQKELSRQARQAAETCERWAREEVTTVNYMLCVVPHGMAADKQYCTKHSYYTAVLPATPTWAECVLCISLLYYSVAA